MSTRCCTLQILHSAKSNPEKLRDIVDTLTQHCIEVIILECGVRLLSACTCTARTTSFLTLFSSLCLCVPADAERSPTGELQRTAPYQ